MIRLMSISYRQLFWQIYAPETFQVRVMCAMKADAKTSGQLLFSTVSQISLSPVDASRCSMSLRYADTLYPQEATLGSGHGYYKFELSRIAEKSASPRRPDSSCHDSRTGS